MEFLKDAPDRSGFIATGAGELAVREFLPIEDVPLDAALYIYVWDSLAGREVALFYRVPGERKRRRDYMVVDNLPVQYGGDHDATKAVEDSNG